MLFVNENVNNNNDYHVSCLETLQHNLFVFSNTSVFDVLIVEFAQSRKIGELL